MDTDCLYTLRVMFDTLPQYQTAMYGTDQGPWLTAEGERMFYANHRECRPSDAVLAMDQFVLQHPEWVDHFPGGTQILNQQGLIAFAQTYPHLAGDPSLTTRLPVPSDTMDQVFGPTTPLSVDDQWKISAGGALVLMAAVAVLAYDYGKSRKR